MDDDSELTDVGLVSSLEFPLFLFDGDGERSGLSLRVDIVDDETMNGYSGVIEE